MKGNGIIHKCNCCGYEVDYDYVQYGGYERTVGDEDFIRIKSGLCGSEFETDVKEESYYGEHSYKVTLLGCPKCKTVSYQFE